MTEREKEHMKHKSHKKSVLCLLCNKAVSFNFFNRVFWKKATKSVSG